MKTLEKMLRLCALLFLSTLFAGGANTVFGQKMISSSSSLPSSGVIFDDFRYGSTAWSNDYNSDYQYPGDESMFVRQEWKTNLTNGAFSQMERMWYHSQWQEEGDWHGALEESRDPLGLYGDTDFLVDQQNYGTFTIRMKAGDYRGNEHPDEIKSKDPQVASGLARTTGTWAARIKLSDLVPRINGKLQQAFWLLSPNAAHTGDLDHRGNDDDANPEVDFEWFNRADSEGIPWLRAGHANGEISSNDVSSNEPLIGVHGGTVGVRYRWGCTYWDGSETHNFEPAIDSICTKLLLRIPQKGYRTLSADPWVTLMFTITDDEMRYHVLSDGGGGWIEAVASTDMRVPNMPQMTMFSVHVRGHLTNIQVDDDLSVDWFYYSPNTDVDIRDLPSQVQTIRSRGYKRFNNTGLSVERPERFSRGMARRTEKTSPLSLSWEVKGVPSPGEPLTLLALPPLRHGVFNWTWEYRTKLLNRAVGGYVPLDAGRTGWDADFTYPSGDIEYVEFRVRLEELDDNNNVINIENVVEPITLVRRIHPESGGGSGTTENPTLACTTIGGSTSTSFVSNPDASNYGSMTGSGRVSDNANDHVSFCYTTMQGDGEFVTQFFGASTPNDWSKFGVMMRESLNPDSKMVFGNFARYISNAQTGATQTSAGAVWRTGTGQSAQRDWDWFHNVYNKQWIRVTRTGNTFTFDKGGDGDQPVWQPIAFGGTPHSVTINGLPESLLVGLAVTNATGSSSNQSTVQFQDWSFSGGGGGTSDCAVADWDLSLLDPNRTSASNPELCSNGVDASIESTGHKLEYGKNDAAAFVNTDYGSLPQSLTLTAVVSAPLTGKASGAAGIMVRDNRLKNSASASIHAYPKEGNSSRIRGLACLRRSAVNQSQAKKGTLNGGSDLPIKLQLELNKVNGSTNQAKVRTGYYDHNNSYRFCREDVITFADPSHIYVGLVVGGVNGIELGKTEATFTKVTLTNDPVINFSQVSADSLSIESAGSADAREEFSIYPNPFNPTTTLNLAVDQTQNIRVTVYNMLGQEVDTFYDGRLEKGEQQSIAIDLSSRPTGQYLVVAHGSTGWTRHRLISLVK